MVDEHDKQAREQKWLPGEMVNFDPERKMVTLRPRAANIPKEAMPCYDRGVARTRPAAAPWTDERDAQRQVPLSTAGLPTLVAPGPYLNESEYEEHRRLSCLNRRSARWREPSEKRKHG